MAGDLPGSVPLPLVIVCRGVSSLAGRQRRGSWATIIGFVIWSSSMSRNALLRISASRSSSKGRKTDSCGSRWDGTMQRYLFPGSIKIFALPRWIR